MNMPAFIALILTNFNLSNIAAVATVANLAVQSSSRTIFTMLFCLWTPQ